MYIWMLFRVEKWEGEFVLLELEETREQNTMPRSFMEKCFEDPISYYISVQPKLAELSTGGVQKPMAAA